MGNYLRTTNGSQNQRTDREPNESEADWLTRHVNELIALIGEGFIVGLELCTRWEDGSAPYGWHDCCTSRNVGETDAQYLDRHFAQVAEHFAEHPPT